MDLTIETIDLSTASKEQQEKLELILWESPFASIFHTFLWNKLLTEESNLRNTTLLALNGGKPVALYTFYADRQGNVSVLSSPVEKYQSIYGGPISLPGYEEAIPELLKESETFVKANLCYVKTTPHYPRKSLSSAGYECSEGLTSIIDLQKEEGELFDAIERRARKSIRKAIKSGVTVTEGTSSDFDQFYLSYKSLCELITEKSGRNLFILPKRFCRRVWDEFSARNEAFMLVGRLKDKITNSSIQLCYKDTVYSWVLGTKHEYREYQVDSLLYWTLIKWARDHGYKYLDLCDINRPESAKFKRAFGGNDACFYFSIKKAKGYYIRRLLFYLSHPKSFFEKVTTIYR